MNTIIDYNESNDTFTVERDNGTSYTIDAGTLANVLDLYDEPHEFIGVVFSVAYDTSKGAAA
jgi:hypothetical protein